MKLLAKLLLYLLALVGLIAIAQLPQVKQVAERLFNKMSQAKFKSSFANSQIKNLGVEFYGGSTLSQKNKLTAKRPGKWLVGKLPQDDQGAAIAASDIDSDDIELVIFSAASGDIIEIQKGVYEVHHLDINKALEIRGLTNSPQDVQINVTEKTLFEINSGDNQITLTNLTLRSVSKNFQQAAFWIAPDQAVTLKQVELFSHSQEKGIRLDANSVLELEDCFISAGPRGTGIELQGNAILRAKKSVIKNTKTAIYGHIDNFSGVIQLEDVELTQAGAKAIDVYHGQLLMKGGKMAQNMAGLSIRNQAKGLLENVEVAHSELTGVDISQGGVLEVRGGLFHHNGQADIIARKEKTLLTLFQSQFSDSLRALELREGAQAKVHDCHFELLEEDAIKASEEVTLAINGGKFVKNHRAVFLDRSKAKITLSTFERNDLAIHLENQSELQLENIQEIDNGEFLHNTYHNSTVIKK